MLKTSSRRNNNKREISLRFLISPIQKKVYRFILIIVLKIFYIQKKIKNSIKNFSNSIKTSLTFLKTLYLFLNLTKIRSNKLIIVNYIEYRIPLCQVRRHKTIKFWCQWAIVKKSYTVHTVSFLSNWEKTKTIQKLKI